MNLNFEMLGCTQKPMLRDRRPSTTACLAGWAMGTSELKKVYGKEKIFCVGLTRSAKAGQIRLYLHDKPNEPTTEGPLSFVLFESPFQQ